MSKREISTAVCYITRHVQGTVKDCWDEGWSLSLAAQLSDQRLEEFLSM